MLQPAGVAGQLATHGRSATRSHGLLTARAPTFELGTLLLTRPLERFVRRQRSQKIRYILGVVSSYVEIALAFWIDKHEV